MLGVVVPYWNLFGDRRRVENLDRCLARLRGQANVRVLCVELDCGHRSGLADVVLTPSDPAAIYLWQKERLINHGFSVLADDNIDCLGYVDGDCLFTEPNWADHIQAMFEAGYTLVQGFTTAVNAEEGVRAALTHLPALGNQLQGGSHFLSRKLLEQTNGLYEFCIVGGGDSALLMAVTGDLRRSERFFPSVPYREHVMVWMQRFRDLSIRAVCAENVVEILDHGNPQRGYNLRHALLQDFDPEQDIVRGDTLGLTEKGQRLVPRLRAYCAHREDRADIIAGKKE